MKVPYSEKNERRKLYRSSEPGHRDGRALRRATLNGAFGDKNSRAEVNLELMILGTIRER